jgi:hypothetical protein
MHLKTELKSEYLRMTVIGKGDDDGCVDHWLFSNAMSAIVVV